MVRRKNLFYLFICLHLVWADNADVISLQYAGTGALKTDYTRYERLTKDYVLLWIIYLELVNDQPWVYSKMVIIHVCVMY